MKTLLLGSVLAMAVAAPTLVAPAPTAQPVPADPLFLVSGTVTDAHSGQPLGGVQVTVPGTGLGTLSRVDGRYTLDVPPAQAGTHFPVRFELVGFGREEHRVRVDGAGTTLDVALQAMPIELEEMVVTGEQAPPRKRSLGSRLSTIVTADASAPAFSTAGGRTPRFDPESNTESYAHISENAFKRVSDDPLSTFSIDVDRASYANVRRFITDGTRPPVDAVRIEELINYFPYDYAEPQGRHPLAVGTNVMTAPWNEDHLLVRVGLQGQRIDMEDAPPSNLVFLMDVSGSMNSPDKLPLLKRAFGLLVDQLRPQDRVAIVVYAGAAGLVLPSTAGNRRGAIMAAIENLQAGGSTAGGEGLRLAYSVARENFLEGGNNRVILATDGDFNVGPSSDSEMVRLVERAREDGTYLTVLGFGTGNLKDSKMEQMADHGNGNYAYIDNVLEARKVLVNEMGGTLLTIAKDVKLQVEFNPAAVQAYRLIGYENRLLAHHEFNDDTKDAGELGAGHSVTALYEVVPVGAPAVGSGLDALRYQDRPAPAADGDGDELMFVKLRYKRPDASTSVLLTHPVARTDANDESADLRFAAAVAGFGMLLRDSDHCGDLTLEDVAALARGAQGADADGSRAEFLHLVERTERLGLLEAH